MPSCADLDPKGAVLPSSTDGAQVLAVNCPWLARNRCPTSGALWSLPRSFAPDHHASRTPNSSGVDLDRSLPFSKLGERGDCAPSLLPSKPRASSKASSPKSLSTVGVFFFGCTVLEVGATLLTTLIATQGRVDHKLSMPYSPPLSQGSSRFEVDDSGSASLSEVKHCRTQFPYDLCGPPTHRVAAVGAASAPCKQPR